MIRLQFNDFQEKMKQDQLVNHYATIHCMSDMDKFVFVMKSREKCDYYTIMLFEDIFLYAENNSMNPEEVFDIFVTNYCTNTLPFLPPLKEEVLEEIENPPAAYVGKNVLSGSLEENQNKSLGNTMPPSLIVKDIVDSGDELVAESKDYSDFLLKFYQMLERKVLVAAADIEKSYMTKTFGEFIKNLFNIVNTVPFANHVRRFIKADLINGLVSAEAELKMDIGYTEAYKDKLNQLASQQIDGYMINGKKWPGIKGTTKEIQAKVIQTVQGGINEKQSLNQIRDNIKEDFSAFSEWRSNMIARTETTRITNEGKMLGYKETGMPGKKIWNSAIDNRTTDICRRLNGQEVDLDNDFIDPETRKAYITPPAHPNCRSTIFFRPD